MSYWQNAIISFLESYRPVFGISVEGAVSMIYFHSCNELLIGIFTIKSLNCLVIFSDGTIITSLSIRFIVALAIASFRDFSENSNIHMKPSRSAGNDSDPGFMVYIMLIGPAPKS
ncbi:MAG TPA: hypothetical protein VLE21_05665 [Candidatus Nitrosocosmicus sp.]|nr:hypothetical protein [Candidatus Nitrosocosmicus sp.]